MKRNLIYCSGLTFLFSLLLCVSPASSAQDLTELDGTPIDSRTRRAWAGNWREFARFASVFEDQYILIPGYDRRTPSSRGLSERQAAEDLTVRWKESSGIVTRTRQWTPPREESEAYANVLPAMELGNYGHIHSVEVVEILGPDQMLVKELWLIDAESLERQYNRDRARARNANIDNQEQVLEAKYGVRLALKELQEQDEFEGTFRLVGFDTRGLTKGNRFDGLRGQPLQVAFVKWDIDESEEAEDDRRRRSRRSRRGDNSVRVLIDPTPVMRSTLDEKQFINMLGERGLGIKSFVELVRDLREADRDLAEQRIANELLPPAPAED